MDKTDPLFKEYAKFYEIDENVDLLEITEKLLKSPYVAEKEKFSIQKWKRKIFVFNYLSDGFKIKGLISFTPSVKKNPVLVYLRGGNRFFGLPNPGSDWLCCEPYTIISTTYRGAVSEGSDEFGGDDVNDVKHLIDFIPTLEQSLGIQLPTQPMTLLGASRGGMQMFLALARFPELQKRFGKIISLSGALDTREIFPTRPDMIKMFIDDFGLQPGTNDKEWVNRRNPILAAAKIDKNLPIYIIQGTADEKINLQQGYNMLQTIREHGGTVVYKEIEGAQHCLRNIKNRTDLVLNTLTEGPRL